MLRICPKCGKLAGYNSWFKAFYCRNCGELFNGVLTMSLDITIKERKEFRCPDCGRLVTTQDIDAECSSGRVWYDFLQGVGYYVEGDNPTEENDWYGEDMVLTEEQAKQLYDFVSDNLPYRWVAIKNLIASAMTHGNKVVINADW